MNNEKLIEVEKLRGLLKEEMLVKISRVAVALSFFSDEKAKTFMKEVESCATEAEVLELMFKYSPESKQLMSSYPAERLRSYTN